MQEADGGRRRSLSAGNAKDVALRKDSINDPSDNPFPIDIAEREAHIRACQACRDTHRLGIDEDDLRQNLLAEAVKAWPRYDPSIASPRTFLSGVMRKQALAEKRRAAALHRRELQTQAGRSDRDKLRSRPFTLVDQIAAAELKQIALDSVPPEHREVARLVLEGEGDAAIGEKVGLHRGNVHLLRRELRSIWSKFEAEWRDESGSARRYRSNGESPGGAS